MRVHSLSGAFYYSLEFFLANSFNLGSTLLFFIVGKYRLLGFIFKFLDVLFILGD
jgi:hypothetical protein